MPSETTILPVASGKGGVGKSMLTANLSAALARAGHTVVAVDLDMGGSNLHTWLKLPNIHPGIGDFLKRRMENLSQLIVPTAIEGLGFIPGDGRMPFMANISHEQKLHLIASLRDIQADYLLLDLGAGTALNTLNFFAMARRGLLITTPEPTAIMNKLAFLKNFLYHLIIALVRSEPRLMELTLDALRQPIEKEPVTVPHLVDRIRPLNSDKATEIESLCQRFQPAIVINLASGDEDVNHLKRLKPVIKTVLAMEIDFWFHIPQDDTLKKHLRQAGIFVETCPTAPAAEKITELARILGAR